jgi:hypothetical protein
MEEKLANARLLIRQKKVEMPVLMDGMDEAAHRRFGRLPNMVYVVDMTPRAAGIAQRAPTNSRRLSVRPEEGIHILSRLGHRPGAWVKPSNPDPTLISPRNFP